MSDLYQSLSHSKWDCKYHVVFVPKQRRKDIRANASAIGTNIPCLGAAERMPNRGRTSHAGPRAHVH